MEKIKKIETSPISFLDVALSTGLAVHKGLTPADEAVNKLIDIVYELEERILHLEEKLKEKD